MQSLKKKFMEKTFSMDYDEYKKHTADISDEDDRCKGKI